MIRAFSPRRDSLRNSMEANKCSKLGTTTDLTLPSRCMRCRDVDAMLILLWTTELSMLLPASLNISCDVVRGKVLMTYSNLRFLTNRHMEDNARFELRSKVH